MNKIRLDLLDKIFRRAEEESEVSGHEVHVAELLQIYLMHKVEDARAWAMYGIALRELGRHNEGLSALTKAYELTPETHQGFIAMQIGVLIKDYRSPKEASAWFEIGTKYLGPSSGWPWVIRGENLVSMGEFDAAIACFKTAQSGEHDQKDEALFNLGLVYRAVGDYEKAVLCLERAIQITPNYEDAIKALEGLKGLNETLKLTLELRKNDNLIH